MSGTPITPFRADDLPREPFTSTELEAAQRWVTLGWGGYSDPDGERRAALVSLCHAIPCQSRRTEAVLRVRREAFRRG